MNDLERQARRARRRKYRRIAIIGFVVLIFGMAWFFESQATTTIIVTRHADETLLGGSNPGLMPAGSLRAEELARVLADVDVVGGVDAIFIQPTRSSQDTILPLSMNVDAPVHLIKYPEDAEGAVSRMLRKYKGEIILVVMEAEYIQPLIREMQGSKKLPELGPQEFDNLYIVTIPWFGKVKTLRLRYGAPYVPSEPAG